MTVQAQSITIGFCIYSIAQIDTKDGEEVSGFWAYWITLY